MDKIWEIYCIIDSNINFYEKDIILKNLSFFENSKNNLKLFVGISQKVKGYIRISLIEHFVIRYSKKYNVSYNIKNKNEEYIFNVFKQYNRQIEYYSKKYFDPYRRKNKFYLVYKNYNRNVTYKYKTTICQLNFMRWVIKYDIINYIDDNYEHIYNDFDRWQKEKTTSV